MLHNDQSGWREIATSLEYLSWNERTLVSMLEKGKAKSIQVVHSIFVLLHAICTGEEEIAIWFGSRLMSAFQKRDERITGWKEVSLYSFALHLFAKWRKLPFAYSQADAIKLGVYQELLDGWDNGTTFANCLVAACDYHVEQAFDDSEQDTQDFFYTLYNLFPVEILAIKRIRKLQGLSMPEIDHPLMKTSLANPPEQIPSSQDDILKEVILKVCKDFAITNSWKF